MRKILSLLSLSFILLVSTTAFAQDCNKKCKKAPHGKAVIENLKKDLNLTDKQVKDVTDLFAEMDAKKAENKDCKQDCKEAFNKKMQSILTPEQYAKFKEASAKCPAHAKAKNCKECPKKCGECPKDTKCKKEDCKKTECKKENCKK